MLKQHILSDAGHRLLYQHQVRTHIDYSLHVVLQKLSLLQIILVMLCQYSIAVNHMGHRRHITSKRRYLKHNWINAGELCLFSIKILNGTLEQKNLGVFDVRGHLENEMTYNQSNRTHTHRPVHRRMKKHTPFCEQYFSCKQNHSPGRSQTSFLLVSTKEQMLFSHRARSTGLLFCYNRAAQRAWR